MRRHRFVFLFLLIFFFVARLSAQSPNGTMSGLIVDPSGAVIAGADVLVANDGTGVQYAGKTNESGIYLISNLPPGRYRLQVSKIGFKTLIKPDIALDVQDALAINFTLPIGAVSETVTVVGGAPLVNLESGSVSTVIDRNFVENLPLNGRSFNTLLQLTPGVVIATSTSNEQGQFSIGGQRTSSNSFLVDGVSANFGVSPEVIPGTSGSGTAQAFSALGGTSSLVSADDLEEFRIETSSFAPEFGHSPGGQVLLTTRAGTNDFHGSAFDYFRNDVLDANDWFANYAHKPRAAEQHNDFGGVLGGRIQKGKTFFFASYEGARLLQPHALVVEVPSEYARATASAAIAPFLDAYPQPDNRTENPGVYTGTFTGAFSNPASLNAGSLRIDHTVNSKLAIFGRFSDAPSQTVVRSDSLNELDTTLVATKTLTLVATMGFTPRLTNSLRGNYSIQRSSFADNLDSFGGAVPPSLTILAPNLPGASNAFISFSTSDTGSYFTGPDARNRTTQLNFADDLTFVRGTHLAKVGVDYRAIDLDLHPFPTGLQYSVSSVSGLLSTGVASAVSGIARKPAFLLSQSTSLYAQDTWKISSRVTLTFGVRWELSPAPSARQGTTLAAWANVNELANLSLAPMGTPVWHTNYADFAPRVGVAYRLTRDGNLVLRGGWGLFYDQGSDAAGDLGTSFPNSATHVVSGVALPLTNAGPYIPAVTIQPPYPNLTAGFTPNLTQPYSNEWNLSLEKSFSGKQAVSLTYVGQAGRNLLREEGLNKPNADFSANFLLTQNDARSNYNALQVQYRMPLSSHVQVLASYTWAHSLDNASNDVVETVTNTVVSAANDYASSDFDVRHSLSAAVTYAIPISGRHPLEFLAKDWSVETVVVARSGFPYNAIAPILTIGGAFVRPNLVAGQPLYLEGARCIAVLGPPCAGGKGLNPLAFAYPAANTQGTEGRNDIPGFGLTQVDFSLTRKINLGERVNLQLRADAFNLFNHPNFANPPALYFGSSPTTYLQATRMLNQGLGGLNPLFQEGGPRSLQLSLRLNF